MLKIDSEISKEKRKRKISAILSLFIPGLGQLMRKRFAASIFFLFMFSFSIWLVIEISKINYGIISIIVALFFLYLLNIADAYRGPAKRTAPCQEKCPVSMNVSSYISLISQGKFDESLSLIMDRMPFPSICGRICHHPCENACSTRQDGGPIAIELLKRAASEFGDFEKLEEPIIENKNKTIGIIGAGPAGLSAAYFLIRKGYPVTIYEEEETPGGLLTYAIPDFRLPQDIIKTEIELLKKMGVILKCNVKIGEDILLSKLREIHPAILIATGNQICVSPDIPGINLDGICNALEFLRKVKINKNINLKGKTVVIGGGNTAFDAARTALRCGSQDVTIFYRRDRNEMPGNIEELDMALKEGVKIEYKSTPINFLGDKKVEGIEFLKTELHPNKEGERSTIKNIKNSNFKIETDAVLLAMGQLPDFSFIPSNLQKKLIYDLRININPVTMETAISGIFAAGDIDGNNKTFTDAINKGRKAANGIDWYIRKISKCRKMFERFLELRYIDVLNISASTPRKGQRAKQKTLDVKKAISSFEEVELGYTREEAKKEASRCSHCNKT